MSAVDWAQVVGAGAAVIVLLFAAWQIWLMISHERRRVQPVLIAHETESRRFRDSGGWSFRAFLQNAGEGAAFNVRFGVELDGIRWPYRMTEHDPPSGNRQSVVDSGARLPAEGDFEIALSSLELVGTVAKRLGDEKASRPDVDAGRVYWCRYENAVGRTWETRNPGDRSSDLNIRRVRCPRWSEQWIAQKRGKAIVAGESLDAQMREELLSRGGR